MVSIAIRRIACLFVAALAACGSRDGGGQFTSRDSSGVAILAYRAMALDSAPSWTLSDQPVAILGGDSLDATMDLATTVAATVLNNGRAVVSTANPAELLLFGPDGTREARLGSPGDGPGEFHVVSQLLHFGQDTLFAFDASQQKGLFFAANGMPLGERILPPVNSPVPPVFRGRLADGVFLFSLDMVTDPPPAGTPKAFRNRFIVLGLNARTDRYDTLATSKGAEVFPATTMVGGQANVMAKPLVFGASTQVVAGGDRWYLSTADRFEVETHDNTGKLVRLVRVDIPTRSVGPADQEKYKATVREAYDRLKGVVSPVALAGELQKLNETEFAEHFPAVAQMMTDGDGNLWVNRGFSLTDRVRSWIVLNPNGQLIGRADTPLGSVLSISGERVVVNRKDPMTGRVRLEVYRLNKSTAAATKPDSGKP
jgi:hypothetical protein